MKIGALITAAGMSSRMGEFKPMLHIGAISAAQRVISTLRQAGAEPVVVVTGNQAEKLEHHLSRAGAIFLRNENYAKTDMFRSVCIGLDYLCGRCDKLLFTPVDVPLFTAETARRLLKSKAEMACPLYNGTEGHPIMLKASAAKKLLAYTGDEGLRGALREAGLKKECIEAEDPGVLFDMDTPADYEKLLEYHNRQLLRPVLELRLARESQFFGPDVARFLRMIEETGSVRSACERCGISYSKAWNLLNAIEQNYGESPVNKQRGGSMGGKSQLTDAGRELLARYDAFLADCRREADKLFAQHFGDKNG